MNSPVRALASWEYRLAIRGRWVLVMGGIFALLGMIVTLMSFRTVRALGLDGIGPASTALVNLGVLLPSLLGLLLGAGSFTGERDHGLLSLLLAQPLRPLRVVLGVFLGLAGSLVTILAIGYGTILVVVSGAARAADLPGLAALIGASMAVAGVGVALGAVLASWSQSRLKALAMATGLWIVLALGLDLALAAVAPTVHLGPEGLLVAILANPLEAARILALLGADLRGSTLGPFGAYLLARWGQAGAMAILATDLAAWIAAPLAAARFALANRDL